MSDLISREKLLNEINLLKKSPWYNKDFAAVKLVRKDAVAIVEKCVEEAPGVTEWISVKDKMPKCGERVLIYVANLNKGKGAYTFDKCRKVDGKKDWEFYNRHNANFDVTHWMQLPQKPKSESDT